MLENVSQTLIWRHRLKYTKNKDEKLKNMMKMLLNVIITFDSQIGHKTLLRKKFLGKKDSEKNNSTKNIFSKK